ncbi:hypothetical protein VPH35_050908 [Triticum aestivum]
MYGFSSPSRDVAPPPWVRRRDLLIHVDRIEDWTPLSPRSSSSPQSGLPSSESEVDTRSFPAVYTSTWYIKVEDGQATSDHGRSKRSRPAVVSTGCHGMPFGGHKRSHDGDDGGGRRSWKDTLLGHGRSSRGSEATDQPQQRQRSRTPSSRREHQHHRNSSKGKKVQSTRSPTQKHPSDPVADFFDDAPALAPPMPPPAVANDVDLEAEAATSEPLCFPDNASSSNTLPAVAALSAQACCTPAPAIAVGMQLGAVTQRVQQLGIQDQDVAATPRHLFADAQPALLPPRRPSAPKKTRTVSAPVRQSARQAGNRTKVPVAHRATLRIIRDLGLLGPKDKMTPQAAKALIKKFDEPLTEDVIGLAKLTRQDPAALRIAAGLAGPDGAPLGEKA